jgi:hypothetical protein
MVEIPRMDCEYLVYQDSTYACTPLNNLFHLVPWMNIGLNLIIHLTVYPFTLISSILILIILPFISSSFFFYSFYLMINSFIIIVAAVIVILLYIFLIII